jgi:hypothetical protein
MTDSRRRFLAAATIASASVATLAGESSAPMTRKSTKQLVHHVFFWLKDPHSHDDRARLIEGLETLRKIDAIRELRIGVPAATENRAVVDDSYSVSELMFFDDLAGQKTYQDHPIHKHFIETCSHLWARVLVYDSMDV